MPPDRIPVPTAIHALLGRWVVHFTLMAEDDALRCGGPLALMGSLSRMRQPCASLEELVMLRAFVEAQLDRIEGPMTPPLAAEVVQLCCWLRPYFGAGGAAAC